MRVAATVLVGLVAALHVYFMVLESFLWTTSYGRRVFGTTREAAASSVVLARNQGLYNGFLAAGLIWGLAAYGLDAGRPILTFFLVCVIVAGIVGAATANKRILFAQALPAALALALVFAATR